MSDFDNEELGRIKQWWQANGTALVIGVVVGLLAIGAWQGWVWYQDRQASAAADIYAQVEHGVDSDNVNDTVVNVVEQLKNDYAGTPYAASAALDLAGYYVAQEQYDKALSQLDWAVNNADEEGVRHIARVRKARLVWTQGNADEALSLLDAEHPPAFDALYAELAGDIHAAQGDREAAYKSYQLALESLPQDTPRQALENKLADNAPADDAGAPSEQESASAS